MEYGVFSRALNPESGWKLKRQRVDEVKRMDTYGTFPQMTCVRTAHYGFGYAKVLYVADRGHE